MADTTTEAPITPETAKQFLQGLVGSLPEDVSPTVRHAVEAVKSGDPLGALGMVAGEKSPISEGELDLALLIKLGVINSQTGQKEAPQANTPEGSRFKETEATAKAIKDYLDKPTGEPPRELINMVSACLADSPAFKEIVRDQSGKIDVGSAETIAKTLLNEPRVRQLIRQSFITSFDSTKPLEHESIVRQLRQELEGLRSKLNSLGEEVTDDDINEALKRLNEAKIALAELTPVLTELSTLQELGKYDGVNKARLKRQISSHPGRSLFLEYDQLEREVNLLRSTSNLSPEDQTKIEENEGRMKEIKSKDEFKKYISLERNLAEIEERESRIRELSSQVSKAQNNLDEAQRRYDELLERRKQDRSKISERVELERQIREKEVALQDAEQSLLYEQIKFTREIQSIVPQAVESYLKEAVEKGEAVLREETRKEAERKETADKETLGRAVDKILARIGRKVKRKGGMTTYVPDKKEAAKLLQKLLLPDGIDQLFNPTNGELRLDENHLKSSYGLTDEEAKVFIEEFQKDPTYRKQIASKMAQAVFADYIGQGGRLSKDVAVALTSTEWGKSLLDEGYKLLQERRAELEKVLGKGVISRIDELKGKTSEWFKGNWWKVGGGIALLILLFFLGKAAAGALLPG